MIRLSLVCHCGRVFPLEIDDDADNLCMPPDVHEHVSTCEGVPF